MNISIQKLDLSYLETLTAILSRVVQHLISNGIDQWDEKYPNAEILLRDLESQWAYGLFCDSQLAGYVVLNEFQDKEYAEIPWKYTSGSQLTIHRLFIDPQYQGRGLAQKMLAFAETFGKEHGYFSIRLDAFPGNTAAIKLYEKNNYEMRGSVRFRKGEFYCYEKLLISPVKDKKNIIQKVKDKAGKLKSSLTAVYYAYKDPRVGILPKLFIGLTLLYAVSPVDLIPDFIPVLGYLDDLLILPLLITLAVKMIPKEVMKEAVEKAEQEPIRLAKNWTFAVIFIGIWILLAYVIVKALVGIITKN